MKISQHDHERAWCTLIPSAVHTSAVQSLIEGNRFAARGEIVKRHSSRQESGKKVQEFLYVIFLSSFSF
jgi:hypothetical protein